MSIHKSLKPKGRLKRQRNVLTRRERVEQLMEEGEWDEEEDSVFGLPKVKTKSVAIPATQRGSDEEEEESEEEAEEGLEETADEEVGEEVETPES